MICGIDGNNGQIRSSGVKTDPSISSPSMTSFYLMMMMMIIILKHYKCECFSLLNNPLPYPPIFCHLQVCYYFLRVVNHIVLPSHFRSRLFYFLLVCIRRTSFSVNDYSFLLCGLAYLFF